MNKRTKVGTIIMAWCTFAFLVLLPLSFFSDLFALAFFFWQLIGFTSAMLFYFNKIGLDEEENGKA